MASSPWETFRLATPLLSLRQSPSSGSGGASPSLSPRLLGLAVLDGLRQVSQEVHRGLEVELGLAPAPHRCRPGVFLGPQVFWYPRVVHLAHHGRPPLVQEGVRLGVIEPRGLGLHLNSLRPTLVSALRRRVVAPKTTTTPFRKMVPWKTLETFWKLSILRKFEERERGDSDRSKARRRWRSGARRATGRRRRGRGLSLSCPTTILPRHRAIRIPPRPRSLGTDTSRRT
mmetsp:Transcript_10671/g.37898  ORF Transcript_10671/g.37898 Transcript_10671/m.37898 type:complete len:229 (+) Transcript_10671:75-761(+)